MNLIATQNSLVSFCISTYKRPELLSQQLASLLQQSFKYFDVVISDNDPDGSAGNIAASFHDSRIKYFHNGDNLGMMRSFNMSIERAVTDYVVMITDDDPIIPDFLADVLDLVKKFPGYSVYGGFIRKNKEVEEIEIIQSSDFIAEILDPDKTPSILWSSCILRRQEVIAINKIPDYGSPHLADHALVALTGSREGGVIINKMYSSLTQHDNNFSKFNFDYYTFGCKGFYETMTAFLKDKKNIVRDKRVVDKHLGNWFVTSMINLKRYYSIQKNTQVLAQIDTCAKEVMSFPFMKMHMTRYYAKRVAFEIKKYLHLLR